MTRKEKMEQLEARLMEGIQEYFVSEKYATLLKVMSKFRHYSVNNCILIASQYPEATYVTGYGKWKTMNRIVKKGEKAIRIISPCLYKVTNEETGEEEELLRFRAASVFDISQTIQIPGTPQLRFEIEELTGDVPDFDRLIKAITKVSPCPVSYVEISDGAKGYYRPADNTIAVCEGMSQLQTVKTLIHEIAHACLHNPEASKICEKDRNMREIEAESTAYIVASCLGLDTSDYSFEYIASWAGKDNLSAVIAALKSIQYTADRMFLAIEKEFGCPVEKWRMGENA